MFLVTLQANTLFAQETVAGIRHNPVVSKEQAYNYKKLAKTTTLTLPFFEDFTDYSPLPNPSKWTDKQVYVNNTMPSGCISRGVATFDGLNAKGLPYANSRGALLYSDSLTSQPMDLSTYSLDDSIYLSFWYQAGGNGFLPNSQDSFMLFFKHKLGKWEKVWSHSETVLKPFQQALVGFQDTGFYHSDFQFRFVNKSSFDIKDDIWNLDYIKIDINRSKNDTLIHDIALSVNPTSLLKEYESIPYKQYKSNPLGITASDWQAEIYNNSNFPAIVGSYGYLAEEKSLGVLLNNDVKHSLSVGSKTSESAIFDSYQNGSLTTTSIHDKVVFTNTFYLESTISDASKINDTLVHEQIFDNYLAYDDGTAEMSYYLNLFPTLPGKIAIEHELFEPDTLRGVAIYFGRQLPLATYKYFNIDVYESIAYNGATDKVIYKQESLMPNYVDTVNHFWIYKFDAPIIMPKGTFYIGTTQPALSGSDSLYFGLDRNRKKSNHAYYNVMNNWQPSLIEGAIMIRPLIGRPIEATTHIQSVSKNLDFILSPNPASNQIKIALPEYTDNTAYKIEIYNLLGSCVVREDISNKISTIAIAELPPQQYILKITDTKQNLFNTKTFIKE
jgi:hypothetical protein